MSATGTCGWCDRPDRELRPCCERGDHDTLVCADSRDCMAAIQATLRAQEAAEAAWLAGQSVAKPALLSAAEPAEVIAGRAILADFQREAHEFTTGARQTADWLVWALRLGQHLQAVLDTTGHTGPPVTGLSANGSAWLTPGDVRLVRAALGEAARAADPVTAARLSTVAQALRAAR